MYLRWIFTAYCIHKMNEQRYYSIPPSYYAQEFKLISNWRKVKHRFAKIICQKDHCCDMWDLIRMNPKNSHKRNMTFSPQCIQYLFLTQLKFALAKTLCWTEKIQRCKLHLPCHKLRREYWTDLNRRKPIIILYNTFAAHMRKSLSVLDFWLIVYHSITDDIIRSA